MDGMDGMNDHCVEDDHLEREEKRDMTENREKYIPVPRREKDVLVGLTLPHCTVEVQRYFWNFWNLDDYLSLALCQEEEDDDQGKKTILEKRLPSRTMNKQ